MLGEPGVWLRCVLGAGATWRLSHLLVHEDGPGDVLARLRRAAGDSVAGRLIDCFGCVSLWVSVPFAFYAVPGSVDRVVAWLALSGAAFLLESALPQPLLLQPLAAPVEEKSDGVLRTDAERG